MWRKSMKIKLMRIMVCLLLILPVFSFTTVADPGPKLEIKIVGGLPINPFIHYVGGVIGNIGDAPAYNISCKMTIKGGFGGTISETRQGYADEILPNNGYAIAILDTVGFGPVLITMTASAINVENVTGTAKGFQIGGFTWVPFSWIRILT
jgi:hypothetical protein